MTGAAPLADLLSDPPLVTAAAATLEISGDGRERPVGLRRFGSKRLGMRSVAVERADLSELAASGAASTQKGAGCG